MKEGTLEINGYSAVLTRWILILFISILYASPASFKHALPVNPVDKKIAKPEKVPVSTPKKRAVSDTGPGATVNHKRDSKKAFYPIIQEAAEIYNVEPALIKAIIMAESSYNPEAVSRKGAIGLMQLMPTTARSLGVKNVFNPEHNIKAGVRYFKQLMDRFNGDARLALAAYNAGSRKVRQYEGVPPYKSTQCYIRKVFKYYEYYKEKDEGGMENA